ncbi:MAG TPA: hypothetical protein VNA69_16135 [Thermoanaerobaculia bacterium]|nr:hypothetical protein [Thermoanaerobaculia bacterium]
MPGIYIADRSQQTVKGLHITLIIATVLAAGVLPACVPGVCCAVLPDASTIHAQMPCCAMTNSFAPRDAMRLQPATFAGSTSPLPQMWAPVAVVARPGAPVVPPRVQTTLDTALEARHEPSPPLFLLNAQFLI